MTPAEREALLDLLADLQHDLGKHLVQPLRFLPPEADDAALRAALTQALRETRRGPGGTRSARELWEGFLAELPPGVEPGNVGRVVERALAWEQALGDEAPLPRGVIEEELGAVQAAIRDWMADLQGRE